MFKGLKEAMNKCLDLDHDNTNKQWNEIMKTFKNMKVKTK